MLTIERSHIVFSVPDPDELVFPITHEGKFSYLGFPVLVYSNTDAVENLMKNFFGEHDGATQSSNPFHVSIFVQDGSSPSENNRQHFEYFYEEKYISTYHPTIGVGEGNCSKITVFITPEDLKNEHWFTRSFMRKLLLYITLRRSDFYSFHASAVGLSNNLVMFLGDRGAGKSTLALNCLRNGMSFLSDDLVIRHFDANDKTIWGEPWITYIRPNELHLYPELNPMLSNDPDKKALICLREHYPHNLIRRGNLSAVFLLERTDDEGDIIEIGCEEIIEYLKPRFNVLKRPDELEIIKKSVDHVSKLFKSVPTYKLLNGRNMEKTIHRIKMILQGEI